ncbi:MAG: hypothetical protein D6720_03920 [Gammaproteobacteria bacterium]|nr:MAG: hypothetical protein D6720_03920 [Gammaproteobacteria bacterium]
MIGHLLRRELRARLSRFTFWLLLAGSWLICAWMLFAQLEVYQQILPQLVASDVPLGINDLLVTPTLNTLALLLVFVVPTLGMEALAEERRSGRLAMLLATPLSVGQLLWGKWLGILLPTLVMILGLLLLPASLALGADVEWDRLAVALVTLGLHAAMLSALVLCCSTLTRQPAAAMTLALLIGGFLWLLDAFAPTEAPWRWLALSPHLDPGLRGTLRSDDLGYFLLLTSTALATTAILLLRQRERPPLRPLREALALGLLLGILAMAAWTSREHNRELYRVQPLPTALLQALDALEGPVIVTAWAPPYPALRARIEQLVRPLQDRYPRLALRWIDPRREPQLAREAGVQREGELLIEGMGRSQRVRELNQRQLLRALSRIARIGEPWIVVLQGHGEPGLDPQRPQQLGRWTAALEEVGYRVVGLPGNTPIPDNASLVLVVAPRRALPLPTRTTLRRHLERGGSLFWLHEDDSSDNLRSLLQIEALPGTLVTTTPETGRSPTQLRVHKGLERLLGEARQSLVLNGAHALLPGRRPPWTAVVRLMGPSTAWNETGPLRGKVRRDPLLGEREGPHLVGLAMTLDHSRILVLGDSDPARNGQLGLGDNREVLLGMVNWLTGNRLTTKPTARDLRIDWEPSTGTRLALVQMIGMPVLLILMGLLVRWYRGRG